MENRVDIEQLRSLAPLQHLSDARLQDLARFLKVQPVAAGSVIFEEDSTGDRMFFLVAGQVRIEKRAEAENYKELAILSPGDFFGEMALLEEEPRSARAVALTDATLFSLGREDLDRWLGSDPRMALGFFGVLLRVSSRRLRSTSEQLVLQHDLSHLTLEKFETEAEFLQAVLGHILPHLDGDWSCAAYRYDPYNEEASRVETAGSQGESLPVTLRLADVESRWLDEATLCVLLPGCDETPLGFLVAHNAAPMRPREKAELEVTLTAAAELSGCALQKIMHEIDERLRTRLDQQRAYESVY